MTQVVKFQELDMEDDDTKQTGMPEKLAAHLKFLKEKLSPEDYAAATKELGFKTEITNEELLEAIKALLQPPKEKQDGEEEEDKTKMISYKDFMAKCMADGKDLKTCSDEYKKQYPKAPEATAEEAAAVEASAKLGKKTEPADQQKMAELETTVKSLQATVEGLKTSLAQEKNTAVLSTKVDKLVEEKHLAPSQRDGIVQLAAGMPPAEQEKLLEFFRTTQKLSGLFDDAGKAGSKPPGSGSTKDWTHEYREEIMKKFRIDEIIEDRGVKPLRRNN